MSAETVHLCRVTLKNHRKFIYWLKYLLSIAAFSPYVANFSCHLAG
jgi:hypothetical protein